MTATQIVAAIESYQVVWAGRQRGVSKMIVRLPNGMHGSILHGRAIGAPLFYSEVGVMDAGQELVYYSPVSPYDAVVGFGDISEIPALLARIAALDPKEKYPSPFNEEEE